MRCFLCVFVERSRLEGDGASLLGSTGLLLLLHDSLVSGFYRNGKTELGGALSSVSYAAVI